MAEPTEITYEAWVAACARISALEDENERLRREVASMRADLDHEYGMGGLAAGGTQ